MRGVSLQYGHSMAEMLVSISILSGVTTMALPSMTAFIAETRLRSAMLAVMQGLHLARAEGIRRNGRVVMCKSAEGLRCTQAGNWDQGWIIFHDTNNSGNVEMGETVLYREPAMAKQMKLTGNQPVQNYVSYTALGRAKLLNDGFQAGHFTVCFQSVSNTEAYLIYVDRLGSPRVEKSSVPFCA